MWISFLACIILCAIVLYVPGYLLFRNLAFSTPRSIAFAPIASTAIISIVAIVNEKIGIFSAGSTVFGPTLVLCFIPYLIAKLIGHAKTTDRATSWDWKFLACYAAFGILICVYMFIKPLDGADSFYCRADNATHLNMVRYFVESGQWSSIGATTGTIAFIPGSAGFYPSAWHDLAALVCTLASSDPIVAINATNAVICGLVYPTSMWAFLTCLFPKSKLHIAVGAVASMSVACFPWTFLIKGPLVSNLLSFALLPAVLALFMHYIKAGIGVHWKGTLFSGILAVAALALSQPNGLFCAYIFAAAYITHRSMKRFSRNKVLAFALSAVVFIILWFVLLQLPFFAEVVNFPNTGGLTLAPVESFIASVTFEFYVGQPPQTILAIVAFVGCVVAIKKHRVWLIFPAVYMVIAYGVSRCTDEYLRNVLCGFWYNDPWRLADAAAIFLVPLITMGLSAIIVAIAKSYDERKASKRPNATHKQSSLRVVTAVLLVVFTCYNFFPSYHNLVTHKREWSPFGFMRDRIAREYSTTRDHVYSTKEKDFVNRAMEMIPDGSLVINSPEDGSLFAYGVNGINTYFRHPTTGSLTDDANMIREGLDTIAESEEVRRAVKDVSAEYVLLLDQGVPYDEGKWLLQTTEDSLKRWDGINRITDETPGFETVLSDGDMRLYKITGTDDGGASGE